MKRTEAATAARRGNRLAEPDEARKMTLQQFCSVSAIPVRTLRAYIEQGLPTLSEPTRGKTTYLDSGAAIEWLMNSRTESNAEAATVRDIKIKKAVLELSIMELETNRKEILFRKEADRLLDKIETQVAFEEILAGFAGSLRSLHRYAQDVYNLPDVKATQRWLKNWAENTLSLLSRWRPQ